MTYGFFSESDMRVIEEDNFYFDLNLAQKIAEVFSTESGVRSVADVGCGRGHYCKFLMENGGYDVVHGYDGSECAKVFTSITVVNLALPQEFPLQYDLTVCLEVGEHIPSQYEHTLLSNLSTCAKTWLVLSWALPGQGGIGHVNERPAEWVLHEMDKLGFTHVHHLTTELKSAASYWYFKNTIMVFKRR